MTSLDQILSQGGGNKQDWFWDIISCDIISSNIF